MEQGNVEVQVMNSNDEDSITRCTTLHPKQPCDTKGSAMQRIKRNKFSVQTRKRANISPVESCLALPCVVCKLCDPTHINSIVFN